MSAIGPNNSPLNARVQIDWGYHGRNHLIGNPEHMQRQSRKPSHKDRDLLLFTLWTNGLRFGREIQPLTVALASHIMCEPKSTAAGRIKRLRDDYGLIVQVGEAAGRRKTPFKVAYSQAEMDAIITSALDAYNKGSDTIASNSWNGHNRRSVQPMEWTQSADAVATTQMDGIASSQKSFVSTHEPVVSIPRDGQGKGKGKQLSRQAGEQSNVVPLGTDEAEWLSKKLKAYGKSGMSWAQRTADFLGCDPVTAAGELETWADSYGAFNVVEAIQDAIDQPEIRTTPCKVIRSFATFNANKYGKRPMPADVDQPKTRLLSMSERSF